MGSSPSGTPGSEFLDLRTCISKRSNLQIIRTRSACNSKTQTTSLWQRPLGPPVAPTITSVAMGILGTATLEISAPKEDGGARVTSYLVTSAPGEIKATYKPDQIKAAKISGLIPGNTYSFTVVAINSKGSSPASISSKPTPAPTVPSAPTITKVVATGTNTAQLTFTAPTNDGGSPITSYVARSNPGGLQTTVFQSASGTINISNLTHSSSYTFTLTASNAAGASPESANSSSITTATPPPPPAPVVAAPTPTPTPTPKVIAVAAIAGVTVPVTGATPVTATTAGTGYTGTVSWGTGGPPLVGNFAGATTYTATITLTPTSGYTLTGVAANFFTVAGATSVTNSADSGEIIAVFPTTPRYCNGLSFTCEVGDAGPGGGRIFYVATTPFACGPTRTMTCTYLEAAPRGWYNGGSDPAISWAQSAYEATLVNNASTPETATATGVGWGYRNTRAIILQGNSDPATSAAALADAYTATVSGVVYDDWYLPSRNELNQMCKWARGITGDDLTNLSTVCDGGSLEASLGFDGLSYWSSTEDDARNAWRQWFRFGFQSRDIKIGTPNLRPIRAFGPPLATISVAAIAGVTAPVTGATPVTTTTAGTGYTGTVSWTSSGGALVGNFAGATTYTATITLTPTSGYTLTGVVANFFTVAGATSVTNSADSGEIIAVFPATLAAPAFTLSSSSESRTVNTVATGFTINSTGGAIASFAISPAAPSGMSFSTSTGAFSGTPSVIASATTYTITATNAAGSTSQTFSFTVTIAAPAFTLSSSSETRTVNHVATGFTVNSTGGAIASFAISATPPGMSFSTSTGALTGAPNTVASATNYTITATNASGSATQTFTLTVPLGIYSVGDTGPGGGKIFYVASGTFTQVGATGSMCTNNCKYLEAAPSNWNGASDPNRLWALSQYQSTDVSGIANDSNAYNNALGIGLGYKNSNDIVNQGNDTTTAAGAARAYTGGSKNDWYLPTSAELNLLCQWQGGIAPSVTTLCSFTSRNSATYGAQAAGFNGDYYWSSSEVNSTNAWSQRFASNTGSQANINKSNMAHVRPIRAFGP
jgi:hypothetical protein